MDSATKAYIQQQLSPVMCPPHDPHYTGQALETLWDPGGQRLQYLGPTFHPVNLLAPCPGNWSFGLLDSLSQAAHASHVLRGTIHRQALTWQPASKTADCESPANKTASSPSASITSSAVSQQVLKFVSLVQTTLRASCTAVMKHIFVSCKTPMVLWQSNTHKQPKAPANLLSFFPTIYSWKLVNRILLQQHSDLRNSSSSRLARSR